MKPERIVFSHHAITDRIERMTEIALTIGFGSVVEEFPCINQYGNTWHCLTDTGVVIIKTDDKEKVITLFCATPERVFAYYKNYKNTRPPQFLVKVAANNLRKRAYLFNYKE